VARRRTRSAECNEAAHARFACAAAGRVEEVNEFIRLSRVHEPAGDFSYVTVKAMSSATEIPSPSLLKFYAVPTSGCGLPKPIPAEASPWQGLLLLDQQKQTFHEISPTFGAVNPCTSHSLAW
jgi:hypothetical protein